MTSEELLNKARELYDSGKISSEAYDELIINSGDFYVSTDEWKGCTENE